MAQLNFLRKGNGSPLLFQHGLTANIQQVESLFGDFSGIQLLSIDCPGHGKSMLPHNYRVSFDRYADEIILFLNSQGVDQAIFGGISMGSGISLNIALRYPDRVQAMVLVRPAWLDGSDPPNLQILLPAAKLMNEADGEERFKRLPEFQAIEPKAAADSVLGIFSKDQQPALERVIDRMVGDRPFLSINQLHEVKVPCLILGNDDDPLHPFEMAEKIHKQIGGSVLEKLTSRYIDHQLHVTQVRTSLDRFLKKNNLYQ